MSSSDRSVFLVPAALLVAVSMLLLGGVATASAAFGVASFDGEALNADGTASTVAGAHPAAATTEFTLNSEESEFGLGLQPQGNVRNVEVDLPVGFAGDPTAVPACTAAQFYEDPSQVGFPACPPSTQVGVAEFTATQQGTRRVPVYNMEPQPGVPAQFAFKAISANVFLDARVRTESDYGISIDVADISQGYPLLGTKVTLWGVPADPSHEPIRGSYCFMVAEPICYVAGGQPAGTPLRPFLTNPTSCVGPVPTLLRAESWTGERSSAGFISHDEFGNPIGYSGCGEVPFAPTFDVSLGEASASTPSELQVEIGIPQNENPGGIASSHLKDVTVTLPEGIAVNASSAAGLAGCSPAQIALKERTPAACPNGSKIGTVRIDTPVLDDPLEGGVFLATQGSNPFNSLLALYLVAEGDGVVIKLPGKVVPDPVSGRLTATFSDNPQLPAERIAVRFFGGPRAPVVTPEACGTYTATAALTPWSRPQQAVQRSASFRITSGPGGGACPAGRFEPKLSAGTVAPLAGAASPFVMRVTREGGSQRLGRIDATLPKGLLAKLKGVSYCPERNLSSIPSGEGTAAAQMVAPSCPASSLVGHVTVAAGAGSSPFFLETGRAYLTGPYKGAPLGLAIVTPAVAGPFDLGNVLVRAALRVDPVTAQVTAASDPLPTILDGIPLDLREVRVEIDRPDFTINPTDCDPQAVRSTIFSAEGKSATPSTSFQAANCERLALKPKLAFKFSNAPTRRGGHPKLTATLSAGKDEANLRRVQVTLPKTEFLENAHIRTICTRVQYAAKQCPAKSVYGYARAWTPLLDKPLEGPVYLRSSNHKLPDLVASLDGQIHIDLAGRIDSVKRRIRNTFETVPDAPVTRFQLTMQGGGKGLLANNTDLCKAKPRAHVRFDGQNGKVHETDPLVKVAGCGSGKGKK